MLTTNNADLAKKFKLWRQHSMSVSDLVRHSDSSVIFESYEELGYNYRMTDVQAAIGRIQLNRLNDLVARRRNLAKSYHELLGGFEEIITPSESNEVKSNWQSYCVRLNADINSKKVMQKLLDQGISSRRGIMCVHREPAYSKEPWTWCGKENGSSPMLTESERAQDQCIILPMFHEMSTTEQQHVVDSLEHAIKSLSTKTI